MKNGIISAVMVMKECVGPLCIINRSNKSISGSTDAAKRSGRLSLTLASFEDPFPNM